MNTLVAENSKKTINYEENLDKLVGRSDSVLKILEKSHGILKGKLKVSPVEWQRKLRKEWDTRLKRQYKIGTKKPV